MKPLLSVVVPTFNSQGCVAALLQSLVAQNFRDFEVIVSDGASTDQTLATVQQYSHRLPRLQVSSRPDGGVYDAINRGLALTQGRWLLVMGSDDRLHASGTLAAAAAHLTDNPAALVYGDVRMMASNNNGVPVGGRYIGPLALDQLLVRNICQQAIFYRRSLFDRQGIFDQRYRLHADWDFNLRVALAGETLMWIDLVVADYAATGISTNARDEAFEHDMPAKLRRALLRRPNDRALWPLHRRLLRSADALRRRGRWGAALAQVGASITLAARRQAAILLRR